MMTFTIAHAYSNRLNCIGGGIHELRTRMVNHWAHLLGRVAVSLILATGSMLLPVGAAAAAPMDVAVPSALQGQDGCIGNGKFVRPGSRTGMGKLTIENGLNRNAVVTLTIARRARYSVAVCQGAQYTVTGIQDGTYEAFFTTGTGWDSQERAFARDRTFQHLDDTLTFTTTGTAATVWTVTLHGVAGGNTNISSVNPNDYPTP